jgi:hypothetical protein
MALILSQWNPVHTVTLYFIRCVFFRCQYPQLEDHPCHAVSRCLVPRETYRYCYSMLRVKCFYCCTTGHNLPCYYSIKKSAFPDPDALPKVESYVTDQCRYEDNIEMVCKERGCGGLVWILLEHSVLDLVNVVMNFQFP